MTKLKTNYKNTEVGVIPEDWEVKEISQIVDVDPDNLGSSTNPDYIFKYISLEDVDCGTLRNISEIVFKNAPSRARRKVKKDDILISTVRPNLKSHLLITKDVFDWVCSTGFSVLRCKSETNSAFLFNHFFASIINRQIENLITGSNYPAINSKEVKALQIPIPPTLAEQTAIATALSDADALISSLEKLIAKKRHIKQGAMQKLLQPKEDWEVKKLGEIIQSFQLGGNYPNNERVTCFPLIKMGNIQRGYIATEKLEYIPEDYKPNVNDKLHFGDILFNTRNTLDLVGKVAIWRNELQEAYFNSNLMRLKFNSLYISSNFFMCYALNTKYSIARLKDIATGTTSVAAIYTRDLLKIEILFPPLEEQTRIATILSDMDNEIAALEGKLEKYRKVKQGMMQNLLTGKIRLI